MGQEKLDQSPEGQGASSQLTRRVLVGAIIAALLAGYAWLYMYSELGAAVLILLAVALVAIVLRYVQLVTFLGIGYTITAPQATAATPCPTTDTLTDDGNYEAAPKKSAAAANRAASNLLQGRADTEAGLAVIDYSCPNPACQIKTAGPVTATPKPGFPTATRLSLFAILNTLFDLFQNTYWTGSMKYTWSVTVTCSRTETMSW